MKIYVFSAAQGILFFSSLYSSFLEIIKKAFWDEKSFLNGSLNSYKGVADSFFALRVCFKMIADSSKL